MIKNYIRIAYRTLVKKPAFSLVNILGLAIGFTCCLLIMLFVQYERSYDDFQEDHENIYRFGLNRIYPGRSTEYAVIPHSIGPQLVVDFPEVIQQARIQPPFGSVVFRNGDRFFDEQRLILADSTLFDVLSIPLKSGDKETALDKPNSLVITESTAKRYFGNEDPLGKVLETNFGKFDITGIAYDYPENSHVEFDLIASLKSFPFYNQENWLSFATITYVKLKDDTDYKSLEAKIPAFIKKYAEGQMQRRNGISYDEYVAAGNGYVYSLQNVKDIHLNSHREGEFKNNGNLTYVMVFTAIALFILVIAAINFMNLSTARSTERAKEVGVRKVLGSLKQQLINQFLTESIMISLSGLVIAIGLVYFLLPPFSQLAERDISFTMLLSWSNILLVLGVALTVGLLAGAYPAFVLSAFKPVSVLKGKMKSSKTGRNLRNGLVVLQFAISIFLISCTIIIYNQMNFMVNKEMGFTKDQVLVVENTALLQDKTETFRQFLLSQRGVEQAGNTTSMPGGFYPGLVMKVEGTEEESYVCRQIAIDDNFLETMGIEILEGRGFQREFNDSLSVILNKSFIEKLNIKDPIGKKVTDVQNDPTQNRTFTIVGVIDDYHYQSLHRTIEPLAIMHNDAGLPGNFMPVRISGETSTVLSAIESRWNELSPGNPFKHHFVDEQLADFYQNERTSSSIFTIFSMLAIFIACIGLLGLAAYTAGQKTKEIGVRKVLGASVNSIIMMLSKDFLKLIVIAIIIAAPLSYFWATDWLEDFAYSISVNPIVFIGAGLLALVFGLLVVGYQTLRSAIVNPVDSLKDE